MPPTEPPSWNEVADHFHLLVELPEADRLDYLKNKVPSALQPELQSLLACHDSADDFLESPALSLSEKKLEFAPGEHFEQFHIERKIGEGSFGQVYLAYDSALGRNIALKVSPAVGQEAQTMAPLDHQNIVRVHSETHLKDEGMRVLCMQYVPGTTLERLLQEMKGPASGKQMLDTLDRISSGAERFDPSALKDRERLETLDFAETVLWWGVRLARALAYAHRHGVLHLDIKPANILMNPYGTPLLSDFNVSQSMLTPSGSRPIGGTLKYMSPEHRQLFESEGQLGEVDGRSDIYSLGVLIREMLKGRGVPPGLESTLEKATAPLPEDRFASAEDFADALDGCLEWGSVQRELPELGTMGRLLQRNPWAALFGVCLVPQLMGSAINISYNAFRIMAFLTPAQQQTFHQTCVVYNLVVYPACVLALLWGIRPVARAIRRATPPDRSQLLKLPHWVVAATTVGWMPGSLLFPLVIHWQQGPLPAEVFGHFFLSFSLSWLVALTYSLLGVLFLVLRLWYPQSWVGEGQIRQRAEKELEPLGTPIRFFPFMAGLVPLTGAILILITGSGADSPLAFRFLTGALIALGMVGAGFALRYTQVMEQTLAALTQKK